MHWECLKYKLPMEYFFFCKVNGILIKLITLVAVHSVKFIARREWIVAVTNNAEFCVYNCSSVSTIVRV